MKTKKRIRRYMYCVMSGFLAGVAYKLIKKDSEEEEHSQVALPDVYLDELSRPFWHNLDNSEDCNKTHPQPCLYSATCQQKCGHGYECRAFEEEVTMNGFVLEPGQKYCVPKKLSFLGCKKGLSDTVMEYDYERNALKYTCKCKYPDLFSGNDCSRFVACQLDDGRIAPLFDRITKEEVKNINSINLYETMPWTKEPRYYCACKKLDASYTSAMQHLSCIRDPCFPVSRSAVHPSAVGLADGSMASSELMCECGNPNVTRLFGGENHSRCMPLMAEDTTEFSVRTDGTIEPRCRNNRIFFNCNNAHSFDPNVGPCGKGNEAFMTRNEAPQAGQCIDPCARCGNSNACTGFNIVTGKCTPSRSYKSGSDKAYDCECRAREERSFYKAGLHKPTGLCALKSFTYCRRTRNSYHCTAGIQKDTVRSCAYTHDDWVVCSD